MCIQCLDCCETILPLKDLNKSRCTHEMKRMESRIPARVEKRLRHSILIFPPFLRLRVLRRQHQQSANLGKTRDRNSIFIHIPVSDILESAASASDMSTSFHLQKVLRRLENLSLEDNDKEKKMKQLSHECVQVRITC